MRSIESRLLALFGTFCLPLLISTAIAQESAGEQRPRSEWIEPIVAKLVELQEDGKEWPYEGRYRLQGEIPEAYRVGGTSLVCLALLHSGQLQLKEVDAAFRSGLAFILDHLDHEQLESARVEGYDMRVLGQAYALLFLCHVHAANAGGDRRPDIEKWIPKLAKALAHEQMADGGWNYQGRPVQAAFVTASVVQSLLWARKEGARISTRVFRRAKQALKTSRISDGAFFYFGTRKSAKKRQPQDQLPGSIGRAPMCESMLYLLGGGSQKQIQQSLDDFHEHWDELEKRRQKSGTHEGRYLIAPYYFYYGHRYAAQAIELLPKAGREKERQRLWRRIMETMDDDGTWNDREFPRAKNYGTSMVLLSILSEKIGPPPAFRVK